MSMTNEEIALELVKAEKEKPVNMNEDAITLYEQYVKKVYQLNDECNK